MSRKRNTLQLVVIAAMTAVLLIAAPLLAADGNPEDRTIQRDGGAAASGDGNGWLRTIIALAVVIGLILVLRYLLKRLGRNRTAATSGGAVEVLSRTSLSVKHQLVLVRLGKRVLLLGTGPQNVETLSEITDADEAAELLSSVEKADGEGFSELLRRKAKAFTSGDAPAEDVGGEAKSLSEKLRSRLKDDGKDS